MQTYVLVAVLTALALAASVRCQDMQVNTGSSCVIASLDQCIPCTASGTKSYLRLISFDRGMLKYSVSSDSSCKGFAKTQKSGPTKCEHMAACTAAPASYSALHVTATAPISIIYADASDHTGFVYLNNTIAVASGAINNMIFTTGTDYIRFINQYDNGDYLTNHGICNTATSCSQAGYVIDLVPIPLSSTEQLPHPFNIVANATAMFSDPSNTLIDILFGPFGFSVSATADTSLMFDSYNVVFKESDIGNIIVQVLPDLTFSDLSIENIDSSTKQNLVAKVTSSDFESYTDTPCDVVTMPDFLPFNSGAAVATCYFDYSSSFDLAEMFPGFTVDHSNDDNAVFTLF